MIEGLFFYSVLVDDVSLMEGLTNIVPDRDLVDFLMLLI